MMSQSPSTSEHPGAACILLPSTEVRGEVDGIYSKTKLNSMSPSASFFSSCVVVARSSRMLGCFLECGAIDRSRSIKVGDE